MLQLELIILRSIRAAQGFVRSMLVGSEIFHTHVVSGGGHLEYLVSYTYFPAYFSFQFFILKYVAEKLSTIAKKKNKGFLAFYFYFYFLFLFYVTLL